MNKRILGFLLIPTLCVAFASPAFAARLERPLTVGSSGADVTALQESLRDLGLFRADITGFFGPATKAAVESFQLDKGIASEGMPGFGYVGPKTREAFNSIAAGTHANSATPTNTGTAQNVSPVFSRDLYAGTYGEDVKQLQIFLKAKGFYSHPSITGYFGEITKKSIIAFQQAHGIPMLGRVGPQTRTKIAALGQSAIHTPNVAPNALLSQFSLSYPSRPPEPPSVVAASASTPTPTPPSLSVTVTENDADDTVTRGQDITYTLTIDNTGGSLATGVDLTDTIVGSVSDVGTFNFANCGSNYANGSSGQTVTVTNVEVAVATDCVITYHVSVDSDASHQGTITDSADVTAADEGGNNPNATSASTLTVDVPLVSYWADGVSVGNMDSSTNWQEQSGLATPHLAANANYLWSVSDSPANQIQAINTANAANSGILALTGQTAMVDLEDIECASVGGTNYCYAMDFGNNGNVTNSRGTGIDMRIFRFVEPTITGSNISTTNFIEINAVFPGVNGPTLKDAEATIADPDTGDLYIIPKRNATQQVYRLAFADQNSSGIKTLEYMGNMTSLPSVTTVALGATPCYAVDAAISPDGREIFVKNYDTVYVFPRNKGTQTIMQALQQSLTVADGYVGGGSVSPKKSHPIAEPQGEGIAFDYAGNNYYSNSEYVSTEGSSASSYPFFKYSRLTGIPTTTSFQDGVSPTAGYTGTVSTYIWGTNPSTDRSAETTYVVDTTVGNATDDRRGLLKFDLSSIPTNATVVGATLEQWISAEGQGWKVYRMLVPWTGTSTFNSLTGGVTNDGVEASSTESYHNGVNLDTVVNVTARDNLLLSDVQNMVTNPATNYGWLFKGLDEAGGDGVQFDGKASATATRRPKLIIRYITP